MKYLFSLIANLDCFGIIFKHKHDTKSKEANIEGNTIIISKDLTAANCLKHLCIAHNHSNIIELKQTKIICHTTGVGTSA